MVQKITVFYNIYEGDTLRGAEQGATFLRKFAYEELHRAEWNESLAREHSCSCIRCEKIYFINIQTNAELSTLNQVLREACLPYVKHISS